MDVDGDCGTLYWDADGGSAANAVAIAQLQNPASPVVTLHPNDFLIV